MMSKLNKKKVSSYIFQHLLILKRVTTQKYMMLYQKSLVTIDTLLKFSKSNQGLPRKIEKKLNQLHSCEKQMKKL